MPGQSLSKLLKHLNYFRVKVLRGGGLALGRRRETDWPDSADRTLQQVAGLRVTRRTRLPRKASNYPVSVGLKKKEVKTTTTSTTTTPGFTQKHRSGN